ncbi:PREDICTED: tetraspanin-32 [Elephantulus edwardii]|uniref:tetraspanin-32 n=1 Tax=Elephantulus edwardii TaxID=28737 RepID=UPI0003F0D2C2|nr:PREDICTED: tetraspanin-32 [Elephantulus edwardii]
MATWSRVRVAKCQMLATGLLVLLLSLCVATMTALAHFGAHFTVLSRVSLERNPSEAVHRWAFSVGVSLTGILSLGATLCITATVRGAKGLMAGGFLCFALAFCILVQVVLWRFCNPTQVEDAVLDTYDLVYEQVVRGLSKSRWQELTVIQDVFQCCGKQSPFSRLGEVEAGLCPGALARRKDCLQEVRSFLKTHTDIASALTGLGLALTVPAMLLSAFLWAAICSGRSLDHHGTYTLTTRQGPGTEHGAGGPRSPASSGTLTAAPQPRTPQKHRLWMTACTQEDAHTALRSATVTEVLRPDPRP